MENTKLKDLSIDFSEKIINLVRKLKSVQENIISNQIGRSGTSIGANIYEALYAQSIADFVSKLQIALKETSETKYWLELLMRTNYISEEEYKSLYTDCGIIQKKLISSIMTSKSKIEK